MSGLADRFLPHSQFNQPPELQRTAFGVVDCLSGSPDVKPPRWLTDLENHNRPRMRDLRTDGRLDRRLHFTAMIVAAMGVPGVIHATRPSGLELSVVMPVYNEADAVEPVVRAWTEELDRLRISYEFLVYDDGSRDRTADVLRRIAIEKPQIVVGSHPNMGHGPTISRGYREATGDWVFQIDSDDEMSPSGFEQFWSVRADYDLLLGCRKDRQATVGRRIISSGSRTVVKLMFGSGLRDVNTPYRLMRRSALAAMLPRIPPRAFAPNVIMAGLAVRDGLRVYQAWVPHQPRRMGTASIAGWKQWRTALRCAIETASVALGARSSARRAVPVRDGDA